MKSIQFNQDDKISIIGYSGAGKSTLMKYFVKNTFANFPNLVIVDPTYQFSHPPAKKMKTYTGSVKCKYPTKNKGCFHIRGEEQFETICEVLFKKDSPSFLVVDEIDEYTDTHELGYWASLYMEEGRNFHQGGCFSVRRLGRLNKSIFSNSKYLCLFRVINKSDIAYLESTLDFDIDVLNVKPKYSFDLIDLQNSENMGRFTVSKQGIFSV